MSAVKENTFNVIFYDRREYKMENKNLWNNFLKSGSINDYLTFVSTRKENETGEGNRSPIYNGGFGDKGNERGGE